MLRAGLLKDDQQKTRLDWILLTAIPKTFRCSSQIRRLLLRFIHFLFFGLETVESPQWQQQFLFVSSNFEPNVSFGLISFTTPLLIPIQWLLISAVWRFATCHKDYTECHTCRIHMCSPHIDNSRRGMWLEAEKWRADASGSHGISGTGKFHPSLENHIESAHQHRAPSRDADPPEQIHA